MAFHSKKFKSAEINYHIHDKEMRAIVAALKKWEHMLKSCQAEIVIFTDHKSLEYFASSQVMLRCQASWAEFLSEFWFKVLYRPGNQNTKADILSRLRDYADKDESEPSPKSLFELGY